MKTMTGKLRGLMFCLVFLAALALVGRVEARADGTVTVTVERFVLGGGFLVEPEEYHFSTGETYEDVILNVLKRNGYTPVGGYGSQYDSYYLEGIKNADCGKHIPQILLDTVYKRLGIGENSFSPDLMQFSYYEAAGWMYFVNNHYVDHGISQEIPENNGVCRVMFELNGGSDLVGREFVMGPDGSDVEYGAELYHVSDKSDLIRKMGQMNRTPKSSWSDAERSVYKHAVSIMEKMDAREDEVGDALDLLNNPVVLDVDKPGGSDQPGGDTGSLSLSLDRTSLSLTPNAVGSIGYTVSPAGASVTWTSGNPGVAVVEGHTSAALVTAKAAGTVTITATAKSGSQTKTASCTVTVTGEASDEEFTKGAPKVSVTGKTASSVTISWEAYPGAEKYNILRKKTGETFATLAVVGADTTAYTDSTVQPNTNYSYTVEAVKGSLTSGRDTNCLVTTPKADDEKPAEATKPAKPKVTLTAGKKQLTVKWKKISGANGYVIYRSTKKSKGYTKVKTITKGSTTSWKNTKLKSKKTYYYKVRAYRTVNGKKVYSAYSSAVGKKTK